MYRRFSGLNLSNVTFSREYELIYGFPIDEAMKLLHAEVYSVGSHITFQGEKCHMNMCYGMTCFAMTEPLKENNSK